MLRAAEHRRTPWKNGGGETAEVAAGPEGAGLDGFDWRVSLAWIEADGPFSAFPDIDRTLTILDGDGLRLSIGDGPEVDLVAGTEPHAFPGDVPAAVRLIGGPVTVLNAMARRARWRHAVRRVSVVGREVVRDGPGLLFCRSGAIRLEGPDGEAELGRHDAVRLDGPGPWTLRSDLPSAAILVRLKPLP